MENLTDAVIIVAGGTGYVGEGLVSSFLREGARVVVPYRNEKKADSLKARLGPELLQNLILYPAEVSNEKSMDKLVDDIVKKFGAIDGAVASLGGWHYGFSLHRMPMKDWQRVVEDNLTAHFVFMSPVVEHFYARNAGEYIMINGGAAEVPAPEAGANSVLAAAEKMMAQVLREEAHGTNVNITAVIATQPIKTRERKIDNIENWLSAEEVGQYCCRVMTGTANPRQDGLHYLGTR